MKLFWWGMPDQLGMGTRGFFTLDEHGNCMQQYSIGPTNIAELIGNGYAEISFNTAYNLGYQI